ncbi:uncharacterized protein K452DRAFT_237204 [Aplosporella prunicola CBS 121167]|uniref:Uncharacterized protein n=1 Tax=Aplosporella prunicola CBS 121167 TaxID=1176127 RepID=A0A6A6B045_9PEZI|nr:uncharacterized protein K452DRAFT_237204 [Aplosporella prunicola CBS 121167]KAF2136595.1 hypothetical protein K452DRAFT_237204 [Aplosporella prunicola CBS 121167]
MDLRRNLNILFDDWWLWEVAGVLLSASCMAAVIVILASFNGKALAKWDFPIQPNSLVSVFMTVAKSALLLPVSQCINQAKWTHFERNPHRLLKLQFFDDASRGPWGALKLIIGMKSSNWIASWGALLTIIALASDPFAQQIIKYPSRSAPSNSTSASYRVTRAFNRTENWTLKEEFSGSVEPATQAAIFTGIYASGVKSSPNCPTSLCQWYDPMITLGVCSSCHDISLSSTNECSTARSTLRVKNGTLFNQYHTKCVLNMTSEHTLNPIQILEEFKWTRNFTEASQDNIQSCRLYWCAYLYNNMSIINNTIHIPSSKTYELLLIYPNQTEGRQSHPGGLFNLTFAIPSSEVDAFPGKLPTFDVDPNMLPALYRKNNFSLVMEDMVRSLTEHIRTSSPGETWIDGTAFAPETYIKVRWEWLSLPLITLTMAIAYLIVSMKESKKHRTILWKSSTLAPFFHGIQGWEKENLNLGYVTQMNEMAETMRGQLRKGDNGELKFVRADSEFELLPLIEREENEMKTKRRGLRMFGRGSEVESAE